jgi:HKD family nuclease
MKNLELNLKHSEARKHDYKFSFNVTPENYLINKKIPVERYSPQVYSSMQNALFNLKFTF